jgi:hypothetical protein
MTAEDYARQHGKDAPDVAAYLQQQAAAAAGHR